MAGGLFNLKQSYFRLQNLTQMAIFSHEHNNILGKT